MHVWVRTKYSGHVEAVFTTLDAALISHTTAESEDDGVHLYDDKGFLCSIIKMPVLTVPTPHTEYK